MLVSHFKPITPNGEPEHTNLIGKDCLQSYFTRSFPQASKDRPLNGEMDRAKGSTRRARQGLTFASTGEACLPDTERIPIYP